MFHPRRLLEFLHKTSLITLLILSIIMFIHILIAILRSSFISTDSSPFDAALLTFLYYVIPLIALLSFNLFILQLRKLDALLSSSKSAKTKKGKNRPHKGSSYKPYRTQKNS